MTISLTNAEPIYLRGVLGSMIEFNPSAPTNPNVTFRFGTMGKGFWPNYMIEGPDGRGGAYRGNNHQPFFKNAARPFADLRLTKDRFTFRSVQDEFQRGLNKESLAQKLERFNRKKRPRGSYRSWPGYARYERERCSR